MRVLLITTGYNCVREALARQEGIELDVVDVNDFCDHDRTHFLGTLKELVLKWRPHLMITWRCPYVLPEDLFSLPEYGAYNLHPSLLPAYPGLNPWDDLYADNETTTGVTLHKMTSQVDAGDIVCQQEFNISGIAYEDARKLSDAVAGRLIMTLPCISSYLDRRVDYSGDFS